MRFWPRCTHVRKGERCCAPALHSWFGKRHRYVRARKPRVTVVEARKQA